MKKNLLIGLMLIMSVQGFSAEKTTYKVMKKSPQTANVFSPMTNEWDKVFPKDSRVNHKKVTFTNRYGITLAADVYEPKNLGNKKVAALAVAGPFGGVKEQSSGRYAQEMAARGYITVAFDPSYNGESGGEPRNVASPEIYTEDFMAAVDFLGLQKNVDRERIGIIGVCGFGGFGLNAAAADTRVKAIATISMYDMSREMGEGFGKILTTEDRKLIYKRMGEQRWKDAENGSPWLMHPVATVDKNKNLILSETMPDTLPKNSDPVLADFFEFYRTTRGYHPRSTASNSAFTFTSATAFMNFPMNNYIHEISPRPILFVIGENAHSRYFSEDAYRLAGNNPNNEMYVVANATHPDLYDKMDKIPFNKLQDFFTKNLK